MEDNLRQYDNIANYATQIALTVPTHTSLHPEAAALLHPMSQLAHIVLNLSHASVMKCLHMTSVHAVMSDVDITHFSRKDIAACVIAGVWTMINSSGVKMLVVGPRMNEWRLVGIRSGRLIRLEAVFLTGRF